MNDNIIPKKKDGAKRQNILEAKLKIAKDPLSKKFLLFPLLSFFSIFHSQLIKSFKQFL